MAKSSVSLKLLVDTQAQRVLFAEADNDCVDFLFHILSLPVTTVIRLLKKQGMVGSLTNLYNSVENLNESYLQANRNKDVLLKPSVSQSYSKSIPLLLHDTSPPQGTSPPARGFYRCSNSSGHNYVADDPQAVCPSCSWKMSSLMAYVALPKQQGSSEGGFVKGMTTYMVKDNLVVEPMSTISCLDMLNKLKVKDVSSLEEKVVDLGRDETITLLKVSLQSETVLTDVFLKGK